MCGGSNFPTGSVPGAGRLKSELPRVIVIIPAFCEEKNIGSLIREIKALRLDVDLDIVVIDDASTDDTARIAQEAGARTISLIRNLGYGYALKAGYQMAVEEDFDVAVQLDGDGQHVPESIPGLLEPILSGKCDVVIGSRALSDVDYVFPVMRRLGQLFFGWILYRMSGLRIGDPTSGFQALNRKALQLYAGRDFPGDYPDTDMLLYLQLKDLTIHEVAATFRPNEQSRSIHNGIIRPMYYIYKMSFSMLLVYLRNRRSRRN